MKDITTNLTIQEELSSLCFTVESCTKGPCLDSLMSDPSQWGLMKTTAGPDGLWVGSHVILIVGNKTTQRENKKVDKQDVDQNLRTTDLSNLFTTYNKTKNQWEEPDGENLWVKKFFWDHMEKKFGEGTLYCIIHIHIVLPGASFQPCNSFSSSPHQLSRHIQWECPPLSHEEYGRVKHYQEKKYHIDVPQYAVDIDCSNIKECGLFSAKSSELLKLKYANSS